MSKELQRLRAEQPKYGDVIGQTEHGDKVRFTDSMQHFIDSLIQYAIKNDRDESEED